MWILGIVSFLVFFSCGSDNTQTEEVEQLYSLTLNVNGLVSNTLTVSYSGKDSDINIGTDGSTVLDNSLKSGDHYEVSIKTEPSNPYEKCSITNGTGTISDSNQEVNISCDLNWIQDAYLKASIPITWELFGNSVDVSEDGNTIVIGAPGDDNNTTGIVNDDSGQPTTSSGGKADSGAVYVFKKDSSGNWYQDAYIKPSGNIYEDNSFGTSVAISKDGNTIVVGEPGNNSNHSGIINTDNTNSVGSTSSDKYGAAYIFKRDSSGNWYQDAYIKPKSVHSRDEFGTTVAIYGDLVIVGAPYEESSQTGITNQDNEDDNDTAGSDSGAVYVYRVDNDGNWYQDAYIKPSNTSAGDLFGRSVDIYERTIVVGARGEDSNTTTIVNDDNTDNSNGDGTDVGAVYVFKRDLNGDWYQDAYIKPGVSSDTLGFYKVSIYGDTLLVGASGDDSAQVGITNTDNITPQDTGLSNSGAVYVFRTDSSGNWYQDAYIKPSHPGENDSFGHYIDIYDNMIAVLTTSDDHTIETILNDDTISLTTPTNSHINYGSLYIFKRDSNNNWHQDAYIQRKNSGSSDMDVSGIKNIAISNDIVVWGTRNEDNNMNSIDNGDNSEMLYDNNDLTNVGAAYIYKNTK